jgi:YfiH family protein
MPKIITGCTGSQSDFSKFHSENLQKSKSKLANQLSIKIKQIKILDQIHTDQILVLTDPDMATENIQADCIMTDLPDICICVKTADCIPVVLFDPVQKVIAAVHLGRKSLLLGLLQKTILKMQAEYSTDPKNLQAWIYPSLQARNHMVFKDVADQFPAQYVQILPVGQHKIQNQAQIQDYLKTNNLKPSDLDQMQSASVDPQQYVIDIMLEKGIQLANIDCQNQDTFENPNWHSYRRDYPNLKVMASFVMIVEKKNS